jgi:hypothetical protein
MTDRELMQQALEALDDVLQLSAEHSKVRSALRERLAQPEQEPVCAHGIGKTKCSFCHQPQPEQEPVAHTLNCTCGAVWDVSHDGVEEMVHAPNPPQRKPLTDEEIALIVGECAASAYRHDDFSFARAIEAAHGIKGEA